MTVKFSRVRVDRNSRIDQTGLKLPRQEDMLLYMDRNINICYGGSGTRATNVAQGSESLVLSRAEVGTTNTNAFTFDHDQTDNIAINSGVVLPNTNATLITWVNITDNDYNNYYAQHGNILCNQNRFNQYFGVLRNSDTGFILQGEANSNEQDWINRTNRTEFAWSTWHFFAITFNSGTASLYHIQDGATPTTLTLDSSTTFTSNFTFSRIGSNTNYGSNESQNQPLEGQIGIVLAYNVVLSNNDILTIYNNTQQNF